jgi:hypothetical protein
LAEAEGAKSTKETANERESKNLNRRCTQIGAD